MEPILELIYKLLEKFYDLYPVICAEAQIIAFGDLFIMFFMVILWTFVLLLAVDKSRYEDCLGYWAIFIMLSICLVGAFACTYEEIASAFFNPHFAALLVIKNLLIP